MKIHVALGDRVVVFGACKVLALEEHDRLIALAMLSLLVLLPKPLNNHALRRYHALKCFSTEFISNVFRFIWYSPPICKLCDMFFNLFFSILHDTSVFVDTVPSALFIVNIVAIQFLCNFGTLYTFSEEKVDIFNVCD